jgi:TolB-like protein/Tfp pilus assembly protein PilF
VSIIPGTDRSNPVRTRIPPHWRFFGVAVLGLLAASLWVRFTASVPPEPAKVAVRPNSLAVVPFINTNPDPADDYLGPGVAAELTRGLRRLSGLRVVHRSSAFAGASRDQLALGGRLGVGTVLEGTVRRSADRLRVTAHLVDVGEGFDLWSDTYERTPADLLAIQRDITRAIADALRLHLEHDSAAILQPITGNIHAYYAYLAGVYLLERPGFGPEAVREAVAHLNRAVRLDSSFALAHAALANAYLPRGGIELSPPRVTMPRAEAAALQAQRLDSTLGEPHSILGTIRFSYSRNWRTAEGELRRAITLAPDSPEAHLAYSRFLVAMGRMDESLRQSERAVQLSPAAPGFVQHLGWHHLHARQYERARESLRRAIELDSTQWLPHLYLALVEQVTGNYDEALARLRLPLSAAPERPEVQVALGQVYALSGRTEEARTVLQRLQEASKNHYVSPYLIGCLQATLGLRVQAFTSLNRAVVERSSLVPYLRVDPRLDTLRTDARFGRLLRRIRLP